MTRAADLPVPLGALLQGKYRIEKVLGGGGMGVVMAAHHVQLERRVALKFLLPESAHNPEAAARFAREARAASRIQSEHVVRVLDVDETEGGVPYMVMEYLEGEDLAEVLQRSGTLSITDAVDYLLQACEAIAEAHAVGIVHRDLKPANLFLTRRTDGSRLVKVCDFGIAKAAAGELVKLTHANAFIGSPVYSAPEQLRSAGAVDARADIWALGVILFELLTAQTPFNGRSIPELVTRIVSEPPPDVRELRPEVPATLAATISACLQREPERRLANVAILAGELKDLAPPTARISADRIARVLGGSSAPPAAEPPRAPPAVEPLPAVEPPRPALAGTGSHPPTLRAEQAPLGAAASARETAQPQSLSIGTTSKPRAVASRWLLAALALVGVIVTLLVLRARRDEALHVDEQATARSAAVSVSAAPPLSETRSAAAIATSAAPVSALAAPPSASASASASSSADLRAPPARPAPANERRLRRDGAPRVSLSDDRSPPAAPVSAAPRRSKPPLSADDEPNTLDMNLK